MKRVMLTAVLCVFSVAANAASINYVFSGAITRIYYVSSGVDVVLPSLSVGDSWAGALSIDADTPDSNPSWPEGGDYMGMSGQWSVGLSLTFAAEDASSGGWVGVKKRYSGANSIDWFSSYSNPSIPAFIDGNSVNAIWVRYQQGGLDFLTDYSLNATLEYGLEDWSSRRLLIGMNSGSDLIYILGSVTFYNAESVPIPAAFWLFGSALGLLGWMRRMQS